MIVSLQTEFLYHFSLDILLKLSHLALKKTLVIYDCLQSKFWQNNDVESLDSTTLIFTFYVEHCKVQTFWETHKIWKNLPHGFDKSADLPSKRLNHEEDFFKLCVLLKKSELYHVYAVLDPALNVHTV